MRGRVSEDGAIYAGTVVHKRCRPTHHALRYSVFSLLVDLDRLDALADRLRLFSVGRFNLFSLHHGDFGAHDGSSLAAFIRNKAQNAGFAAGRIRMLCYPRILGYAFNPLTVYYVEDAAGEIGMLLFEVHNTFGEHHFYEAAVGGGEGDTHSFALPKAFYVSPFNTLQGVYRFNVRPPEDEVFTGITLDDGEGPLLTAYFTGKRQPLTDGALLRLALGYPLMTLKIVAGIHWEALRLRLKGVPTTLALRRKSKTS